MHVRITDVAPRDGLQNEPRPIPTDAKVRLVDALSGVGVEEVEVSSFVSARWIPQLGDAGEVFGAITPREGVTYSALVPNERGLESALAVRAATRAARGRALPDKLAVFTAASQTFCRRNINATIEESIDRFGAIASACARESIRLRGYVSCAIACPFEGAIEPAAVARVVGLLLELGARHGAPVEIDLGDTIGSATPDSTARLLDAVLPLVPAGAERDGTASLTLHLHDTHGRAGACAIEAMRMGVRSFDSSAGGLGGCPYASTPGRRAPGNISTSALVDAITRAGHTCGVDRARLQGAAAIASAMTSSPASASPAPGESR